jgi:hypothetical protein
MLPPFRGELPLAFRLTSARSLIGLRSSPQPQSALVPMRGYLGRPQDRLMTQLSWAPEASLCRLQHAAGRIETCPEERCPFWEPGGAALAGRCAVEQVDLSGRQQLAAWLLRIRTQLELASTREQEDQVRRLFYRLLASAPAHPWAVRQGQRGVSS